MTITCEANVQAGKQETKVEFEDRLAYIAGDMVIARYYFSAFRNFAIHNTAEGNFRYDDKRVGKNQLLTICFGKEGEELVLSLCRHEQEQFLFAVATHAIHGEVEKIKGKLVGLPSWLAEEQKNHPEQLILITSNNALVTLEYIERKIPVDGRIITIKSPSYRVEPLPILSSEN